MRDSLATHGPIVLVIHDGKFLALPHVRYCDRRSEYKVFHAMWSRCTNPNHVGYERYGGRGISVCDRWKNFAYFFVDMGPRPSIKHTIERRDNDKGYAPANCYWATARQQRSNKRNNVYVERNGERVLLADVIAGAGANDARVRGRLKMGWSLEKALSAPIRPCKTGADRKPYRIKLA